MRENMKGVALQDFLTEEQEPFHLTRYIQERRCQIKKTRKDGPSSSSHNALSSTCFFGRSPHASLGLSSPVFRRLSPAAIVFKVPPATADLLLKAALRIHKPTKPKARKTWLGMVGSLMKRVILKKNKRKEICGLKDEIKEPPLDSFSFAVTSHVASESEKVEEDDFRFYSDEYRFCESPFRFVLVKSPPSSRSTEFSSPTASPCRSGEDRSIERETKNCNGEEEESTSITTEGEKEQCSPVSVLDPHYDDEEDDDHDYDLECSYAIVKRSRNLLMRKLRKFEKLAGVEFEKHIEEEEEVSDGSTSSLESEDEWRKEINDFIVEELKLTTKVPRDIRRLIDDAINEEQKEATDGALLAERVRKRVVSWKSVKCETIEMMVAMDMGWDKVEWKGLGGLIEKSPLLVELDIFGLLLDELWLDLLQ